MISAGSGLPGVQVTILVPRQPMPLHTLPILFLNQSHIIARTMGFFFGCQKLFFPSSSFIVLVTKSNQSITAVRYSFLSFHNKSLHSSASLAGHWEPLPSRISNREDPPMH